MPYDVPLAPMICTTRSRTPSWPQVILNACCARARVGGRVVGVCIGACMASLNHQNCAAPNRALTSHCDAQRIETVTRNGGGDGSQRPFGHTCMSTRAHIRTQPATSLARAHVPTSRTIAAHHRHRSHQCLPHHHMRSCPVRHTRICAGNGEWRAFAAGAFALPQAAGSRFMPAAEAAQHGP